MSLSPTLSGISMNRRTDDLVEQEWGWTACPEDAVAWQTPLSDHQDLTIEGLKVREQQLHVDHVYDMVPFWIRGMEAAEKGEILKLEDFLESLHAMAHTNDWTLREISAWEDPCFPEGGWGPYTECTSPEVVEGMKWSDPRPNSRWTISQPKRTFVRDHNQKQNMKQRQLGGPNKLSGKGMQALVDYVATQQAMDENHRRKRYSFFNMSPDDQLKKIEELITGLRSKSHS
ncbi:hypothetical protein BDQ17DRAFT_1341220 [Cyathus striatus]|nr:hypothetical protein BDQ17DRAFT_1341220 [Cyathus striatus]